MKKVTVLCLFFISIIGSTLNAKCINDNEVLIKEAQEKAFIKNIEFIEIEYEFESNTELLRYLPNDFNPYEGMIFDMSKIKFIEISEPIKLDFNVQDYLPKDFNPYKGQ
jgi:hypothetical protein